MFHCKVMVVDGLLVSVGSTNFDNRSFRLNDEASLNILDREFAAQQTRIFEEDLRGHAEAGDLRRLEKSTDPRKARRSACFADWRANVARPLRVARSVRFDCANPVGYREAPFNLRISSALRFSNCAPSSTMSTSALRHSAERARALPP